MHSLLGMNATTAQADGLVRYTLVTVDGDTMRLTLPEFLDGNECLDPGTVDTIRLLAPGETYRDGGGAAPEWSITRPVCS